LLISKELLFLTSVIHHNTLRIMNETKVSIKAREALRHIRNAVMHTGKVLSVRDLMNAMKYKSPRSALLLMQELEDLGFLKKKVDGGYQLLRDLAEPEVTRTVDVPLVGSVPCGAPLLAEENIEAMIPVATSLARPGSKYFLLRATGDSMNLVDINEGDLLLIKQQQYADHNGQFVVALIDDDATVKEYRRNGNVVMLIPKSDNPIHQPIILNQQFQIQGVVEAIIPKY
jgi:repressor LexA